MLQENLKQLTGKRGNSVYLARNFYILHGNYAEKNVS